MRRFIQIVGLIIALLPMLVTAQEATLNTPVTRSSEAKYKIDVFYFTRSPNVVLIDLIVQDSSNVDIRTQRFTIPSSAGSPCTSATTIAGLAGAMNVARATETGSDPRKQQFRILGYLSDQGCLSGVTLNP